MSLLKYPTQEYTVPKPKNYNNEEKIREYQKTRNQDLKKEIVEINLPLVYDIVNDYKYSSDIEIYDLVSAGTIGLINAVEKYNPDAGFKFSTYATTTIRNSIVTEIYEWYGEGAKYYGDYIETYRQIAIKLFGSGKTMFEEENIDYILELMKEEGIIRKGTVTELRSRILTMSKMYDDKADNIAYEEEDFNRTEFIEEYKDELFQDLNKKEKELIEYRYGYKDGKMYTQQELANSKKITHQAIQYTEKKALQKMKKVAKKYI